MTKSFWDHPVETIERALHIRKQIEALKASLTEIYGDGTQPILHEKALKDGRKGKRSAATRAKMAAAAKARWARKKGAAPAKSVAKPAKKRRKMSAATRARMVAGQRARRTKEKIAPELSLPDRLVW